MGLRGPCTSQPLCSLLPFPSLTQTSPAPTRTCTSLILLAKPRDNKLSSARNLGCHHVPTIPWPHRLCREQGLSSRRNSIVHKGNNKIHPGHPFPAGRDGGSHPAPPPEHTAGKIQPLLTGSLLIPERDPGSRAPLAAPVPPHMPESSFQAAAKGAASPTAATMQQLTGPGVKGNVRASARNIKISDKGAIVAPELLNFRWIHQPLSFTNQPGAMQHPWVCRGREEDKPRDRAWNDPEPVFRGWRLGNYLLCLARSRAPVQCSTALGAAG